MWSVIFNHMKDVEEGKLTDIGKWHNLERMAKEEEQTRLEVK